MLMRATAGVVVLGLLPSLSAQERRRTEAAMELSTCYDPVRARVVASAK